MQNLLTTAQLDIFPSLIHNIGLGLISIFLSAILFVYTVLSKNETQIWDRIILLEKVVNIKDFFIYLSLIFIPPFFWSLSVLVNILIIIFSIIGSILLISQLKNIYFWIKDIEPNGGTNRIGYRQKLREDFLADETTNENKENIWDSTWSQEDINNSTERRLIKIFFEQSRRLAENSDWETLRDWLNPFHTNIEHREMQDWLILEIILKNTLEINYFGYKNLTRDKKEYREYKYVFCANIINNLLTYSIEKAISSGASYILFETLGKHLSDKSKEYQTHLIAKIHKTLFESISKQSYGYEIWRDFFPKEWKITQENINENHISFLFFKYYFEWAKDRVGFTKDFDDQLDEVSRELFPNLSPNWWSEIVTYVIRPYGKNRIGDLFKYPPNFGFIDHIFGGYITEENPIENVEKRLQESVSVEQDNAILMFINYFLGSFVSYKDVEQSIVDLKEINPENENGKNRKDRLLEIFNRIKTKVEELKT